MTLENRTTPPEAKIERPKLSEDGQQAFKALLNLKISDGDGAEAKANILRSIRIVFNLPTEEGGKSYYNSFHYSNTQAIRAFIMNKEALLKAVPESAHESTQFCIDTLNAELKRAKPEEYVVAETSIPAKPGSPPAELVYTPSALPEPDKKPVPAPRGQINGEALAKLQLLIKLPVAITGRSDLEAACIGLYDNVRENQVLSQTVGNHLRGAVACVKTVVWELNNILENVQKLPNQKRTEVKNAVSIVSGAIQQDFPEHYAASPGLKTTEASSFLA